MRKAFLVLMLLTAATTLTWSQSLPETLIEISETLRSLSNEFDEGFAELETRLLSLKATSIELSKQLADLESEVESSEESLTDLRNSHIEYETYVQGALSAQTERIQALETELWVYRIGGGVLAVVVGYLAIRAALMPP